MASGFVLTGRLGCSGPEDSSPDSLLPEQVWKAIELTPQREMGFTLPDGTVVQRQVSECYLALSQGEGHTPVILGEPEDEGLLGVVTLEILGLVLNPFTRTLHPMRALLMRMGHEAVKEGTK